MTIAEPIAEPTLVTAEDVALLADDVHVELIRGEIREMPAAGWLHGGVGGEFAGALWTYGRGAGGGRVFTSETGVLVSRDPDTLLVPDLIYISTARLHEQAASARFFTIPPDVVLEILSPSQRFSDLLAKAATYLSFGVPLVWLADPGRKTVASLTPSGVVHVYAVGDILDGGDVLPEFRVPVEQLFP